VSITDAPPSDVTAVPAEPARPASKPGPKRRAIRIRGRVYPVVLPSLRDPRLHVAAVLLTLQVLGQTVLDFRLSVAQILVCLAAGALFEFIVAFFKDKVILWPASGLLTGNSTAFILRTPGTLHGDWWSLHGIWIFLAVVVVSMASKYLIKWRGRHIFNPSNLGLVIAFVALGPQYTEPQDLWWIPMGPWMIVTYAILIGGGLLIGWELKLLGLEIGYMATFAAAVALSLAPVPDHCMVASWHATAMCGGQLWQILVTSPEVLIFALFMVPDPRTVPDGQAARFVFGATTAILSVLLLGPTTLEFWTKTAILASLVFTCAGRFALARLMAPVDDATRFGGAFQRWGWRIPAAVGMAALVAWFLPVAADLSTHGPLPAAALSDGTLPAITLKVGPSLDPATWVVGTAAGALPAPSSSQPHPATAPVYVLPAIPAIVVPSNVTDFDSTITPAIANRMAHDVVLDLVIEAVARQSHDLDLAATAAEPDGLTEFTDVINQDTAAGKFVQKTYSFTKITLTLYLPKFSTQAARLVGIDLHGSATLTTRNAAGAVLSKTTVSYDKSWGLDRDPSRPLWPIFVDYTGLTPA